MTDIVGRSDWPIKRLKYITDCNASVLSEATDPDLRFRYVDIGSLSQGTMSLPDVEVAFGDAPSRARRLAQPGDSVVSTVRTYLRAVASVPNTSDQLVFSTGFAVLHPAKGVSPGFLAYYLQSDAFIHRVEANSVGVSYPAIAPSQLISLALRLPTLTEQCRIVGFLDREMAKVDALTAKQEQLIETLRERRAAIVMEAVAEASATHRIKDVADVTLGKMLDSGRVTREGDTVMPYVRAGDVLHSGLINLADLNCMPFSEREASYLDLRRDDVLVIEGGATVGKPGYLNEDVPGIAFQKTVNRVRAHPGADGRYLFWALLARYASGYYTDFYDSVSFLHLTAEKLREIPVYVPSLDVQRQIAHELDEETSKIDYLIERAQRFVELSKERRSSLISAAVTGQIDVRDGVHPDDVLAVAGEGVA